MALTYGELKERAAALAADLAAARSARNLLSRRKAEEEQDEREAERGRRRQARKNERELEELLRRKVRVRVLPEERPKTGRTTARSLYHRAAGMLLGVTGLTDARGPDGLYSIHFAFTARGFASTKGRRWRRGEAERAARYIVREEGLERGELGWWSNIAADRNELVAFYRAVEALERHDRSNANVYISEVIALPAELSAQQRRRAVRRICRFFEARGLPYTVAIHVPDAAGDQRNYHCHIIYSLRPCARVAPYEWSFDVAKADDINTPDGIKARRIAAVEAINRTLCAAGVAKRYTHLSNKARGMAAAQAKVGQQRTWAARRLAALEARAVLLRQVDIGLQRVIGQLGGAATRLEQVRTAARQALASMSAGPVSNLGLAGRLLGRRTHAQASLAAADQGVGAMETGVTARLGKVRGETGDRLDRQAAAVGATRQASQLQLRQATAADHLARAGAAIIERRTISRHRLQDAGAAAQRWLERAAGRVPAVSHSPLRLATAKSRAGRIRAVETRRAQLVETLERLRARAAGARATAASALLQLASDTKARSDRNWDQRIKLAGMGAVARLREDADRRRVLIQKVDTALHAHKVFLGHSRDAAASKVSEMAAIVPARLTSVAPRLGAIGRSPALLRLTALNSMASVIGGTLEQPGRLGPLEEAARGRLVGTANQIRWTINTLGAALTGLKDIAEQRDRLARLTQHATAIHGSIGGSGTRLRSAREGALRRMTDVFAAVTSRLDSQQLQLGRVKTRAQEHVRAATIEPEAQSDAPQRHKIGTEVALGAGPDTVQSKAAAGSSPGSSANGPSGSATGRLRKLVPGRTPETELHGPVLPQGGRGPLPSGNASAIRDMFARLRGKVAEREPDVTAELCERAFRRLRISRASITKGADGIFKADDRGLFDEERQVLRTAAQENLVQTRLAELWKEQEARRQAAATPPPLSQVNQAAGVDPDVQQRFLADRFGKAR